MRALRLIYLTLLIFSFAASSCQKPAPLPQQQTIAINYDLIAGCWQLSHWQDAELAEGTHLYIDLDIEQRYTMWDNIDSMYSRKSTGDYKITEQEDGSYTISGRYDNGVGKWSNDYSITLLGDGTRMQWISTDGTQTMQFIFVGELPEIL
jgi:hypothetical protein